MTSASSRDALRQLDQFWSMLDDLSENDPAAYRSFIDKQMKEGAEYNSPPEIHTSLRTEILVGVDRILPVQLRARFFLFIPTQVFLISGGSLEGARLLAATGSAFNYSVIYFNFYLKRETVLLLTLQRHIKYFNVTLVDKLLLKYIFFVLIY